MIDSDTFNPRIQKIIKRIFPTKSVTAIDFRRCIPTLLWNENTTTSLFEDYARLVNTSMEVLEEHYIRGRATEKSKKVLQHINNNILASQESKIQYTFQFLISI